MKKTIAIAILAAFLYNLIGFTAAFQLIRSEWQHAVWAELAAKKDSFFLTTFHFSKKDFDQTMPEFQLNGQVYDVVEITQLGADSLTIVCFNDKKETAMTADFDGILLEDVDKKSKKQQKTQFLFSHLLKDYLFDNLFYLKIPPSVSEPILGSISFQRAFPKAPFLESIAPPPQV